MIGADGYKRLVASIRLDLLALLGKSYIADHIRGEIRKHQEIQFYRDSIADTLGALAGSQKLYSAEADYRFPLYLRNREERTEDQITADNAKALAELCGGGDAH